MAEQSSGPSDPIHVTELSGKVEIYEIKQIAVYAKNKPDADKILKAYLQSEDKVIKMKSERWGYSATIHKFILRDGPI